MVGVGFKDRVALARANGAVFGETQVGLVTGDQQDFLFARAAHPGGLCEILSFDESDFAQHHCVAGQGGQTLGRERAGGVLGRLVAARKRYRCLGPGGPEANDVAGKIQCGLVIDGLAAHKRGQRQGSPKYFEQRLHSVSPFCTT